MKRLLCGLLLALFVGGALGCGKEPAEKKEGTEQDPAAKEKTETTEEAE